MCALYPHNVFCFRERPKKRLIYPGKTSVKKKKKKELSKIEKDLVDEKPSEVSTPSEPTHAPADAEEERIVRKSTRTSVIVRQAERDAIRAAVQATMKVSPRISVFFFYVKHG